MEKVQFRVTILLTLFIGLNCNIPNLNNVNSNMQWMPRNNINDSRTQEDVRGPLDLNDPQESSPQWNNKKPTETCLSNGAQLQNLLIIVCSTAIAANVTQRDSCISCFSRATALAEGPDELVSLSYCASLYFANTSYTSCAEALEALSTSALSTPPNGCFMGYCDFVRCLRRTNSMILIAQCTREAKMGLNITLNIYDVRFYTNVTSCILAKSRCGTYNPITGIPQVPGYSKSGIRISNALQFSEEGDLRIIAFPTNMPATNYFCPRSNNLTETIWLNNVC